VETAQRTVIRVETRTHTGPDAQVDDGYLIISPARPDLTDPWNKSEAGLLE
jgi:quercetin 2,3-dioxygenase